MSGEAPLVQPLEGYVITITDQDSEDGKVILESKLRISKCGGAHLQGIADLVMRIEDAVFGQEEVRAHDD
jgi:hypothetical protein